MTPAQFKAARETLGLSQSQLAHIINVRTRAIAAYEQEVEGSGSRAPNPIACRIVSWLLDGYRPPEWGKRK